MTNSATRWSTLVCAALGAAAFAASIHDASARTQEQRLESGKQIFLDGISVEYRDWWLNVRASNTEPLVRLNVEAKTKAMMEQKRDELLAEIRS